MIVIFFSYKFELRMKLFKHILHNGTKNFKRKIFLKISSIYVKTKTQADTNLYKINF